MSTKPKHPDIKLSPVKSSQIESIGHDGNTLAVKFKNGGLYHYPEFSPADFEKLQKAESTGKHFTQHIKTRKFVKVTA